jgi:uracil-DNA glycosylase
MSDAREAIRAHFDYYRELGVDGISRDPVWRARGDRSVRDGVPDAAPDNSQNLPPGGESAPDQAQNLPPVRDSVRDTVPDESGSDPAARLIAIRTDLGDCTRCKLANLGRKQIVFGVGNANADLMFVGEAPGADEDLQGEPFVGRAGQLLTKIIEAMGFTRGDVYIANVLKCRPPGNRNPEPDEVAKCQPFLFRQIETVNPKVMVALGTFAAQALLDTKDPISRLRGRAWPCRDRLLVPTFHPAFLLRSPERKRDTWDDMKLVLRILKGEEEA